MNNYFEPGQEIETTIVQISGDTIFLDLNAKTEGTLDSTELTDKEGNITVKEGDKIKAFFLTNRSGVPHFTTKIAGQNADADMLEKAFQAAIPVQGKVEKEIKGGFEVKIGSTRAFCPFHRWASNRKKNLLITSAAPFLLKSRNSKKAEKTSSFLTAQSWNLNTKKVLKVLQQNML